MAHDRSSPTLTAPAGDGAVLNLWVNGRLLGTWSRPAGEDVLTYDPDWIAWSDACPLSRMLPLDAPGGQIRGHLVARYFDNLLPDSLPIRQRLAVRWAECRDDAFSLLTALGRDCVGALQILPAGVEPGQYRWQVTESLSGLDVERILLDAVGQDAGAGGFNYEAGRLALAGAQEKTALLRSQGSWRVPLGPTPSSHILKLPMGLVGNSRLDLSRSVDNEWLCMQILAAYGLPVATTEILTFGKMRVLGVERFDRCFDPAGGSVQRLMQEDFCQAMGMPSSLKYECDGGPTLANMYAILLGSVRAVEDCRTLTASQVLFWMLAATDGHAKNFSLQHLPGGGYQLAPLYDVLSMHPLIGPGGNQVAMRKVKLAMALRGKSKHYEVARIQRRHFNASALAGFGMSAEPVIQQILAKTPDVVASVRARLPVDFDMSVANAILGGLTLAAKHLADMPTN